MATSDYNYTKQTEYAAYAPLRRAFDITPSSNDLALATRVIMVSEAATVTGVFVGQDSSHTTFNLTPGIPYPFCFKKITAVSAGSVKGYA